MMPLPQPIAGQTLQWSPQAPGSPWQSAAVPGTPYQVSFDPSAGLWDYSDPSAGIGDRAGGLNPTSFQAAQTQFQQANPGLSMPSAAQTGLSPSLVQALSQPTYAAAPTIFNPSYASGAQLGFGNVDPSLISALSPLSAENLLVQGFQPQAQQAEENLNQTLANAGIVGGQAVAQQQGLQEQLASALAPSLAGLVSGSQGNLLSAATGGSGLQQQTGLANMAAANEAGLTNTGAINATNAANTGLANQNQQALLNYLMQLYQQQAGQYGGVASGLQGGVNNVSGQTAGTFQQPTGAGAGAAGLTNALGQIYQPRGGQTGFPQSNVPAEPMVY